MKKFILALALVLIAAPAFAATVTLNITAGANAVSHTIEKSTNGGAYSVLTTVNMPELQYIDTAVTVSNTYAYRVKTNSSIDSSAVSTPCTIALLAAGNSTVSCTANP